MDAFHFVATAIATLLAFVSLVFAIEVFAASFLRPAHPTPQSSDHPPTVVIIPAHNESGVVGATVEHIKRELHQNDRLIVVADNCSDSTAHEAWAAGAEVWERHDPDTRGKGYALSFAIRRLTAVPPAVIVCIDADCRLSGGGLNHLVRAATGLQRPVQARNLVSLPPDAGPIAQVSALAFLVRSLVRPLGLKRLGLPCGLGGTGMAIPWVQIASAPATDGDLVEDLNLGLNLALQGYAPIFCPEVTVSSEQPASTTSALQQRRRWEHGHLSTIVRRLPGLIVAGIRKKRIDIIALAMDLAVPPIALLTMGLVTTIITGGILVLAGAGKTAFIVSMIGFCLVITATAAAWWRFARTTIQPTTLLLVPFYLTKKLPLYLRFFLHGRHHAWERSARPSTDTARPAP